MKNESYDWKALQVFCNFKNLERENTFKIHIKLQSSNGMHGYDS